MPFLDSPTIRPLYDVRDGGPPVGFRCMIVTDTEESDGYEYKCSRVVRTLAGMRTHQRIVHGVKQQQEFRFETINRPSESI